MKRLLLLAALTLPALAFAQGDLTPPPGAFSGGTPAPSMKTLTQVEPRTPLELTSPGVSSSMNGGFIIDLPGSYYLTGNLTLSSGNAIDIGASNVTLDLNGFSILSTADANVVRGAAIEIPTGVTNVTIRNGHIAPDLVNGTVGCGFDNGIKGGGANVVVEDITVCGMGAAGIELDENATITRCAVSDCAGGGIRGRTVSDSTVNNCQGVGINASTVHNCHASTSNGEGILATNSVSNSYGKSVKSSGISGQKDVANSTGYSTERYGILAENVSNSYGLTNASSNVSGIDARNVSGSYGKGASGPGITATSVSASTGDSTNKEGISCTTAENSFGSSTNSTGLSAATATNCYGYSFNGWGLYAQSATNCHGQSEHGTRGLNAENTATGCTGLVVAATTDSTVALFAANAENCRGEVKTGYTSLNPEGSPCTGLKATVATNCTGSVVAMAEAAPRKFAYGLHATKSTANCAGSAPAGCGLYAAESATNCTGTIPWVPFVASGTDDDCGIITTNANGCTGSVNGGTGLWAETAANCRGTTVNGTTGLWAESTATNCYGSTVYGDQGLWTKGTASFCRGYHGNASGTALHAQIAVACTAEKGVITVEPTGSKQLGTP